jgi:ABC-type lipoprotein export system ATPase subunit
MAYLIETNSVKMEYPHSDGVIQLYDEGVSLRIDPGDFVAVLGGSGWGKSTLVNIILGLEKPTSGTVHFSGEDVTRSSFVKRCSLVKTGAVFQRPTAVPQLTVGQNINLALSMAGIPKGERDERIRESIAFFGLERITRAYPESLSAGQRKRIDLARALAIKPQLLVLDEPTGDLDTSAANLVMPLLRGLNKDHGTTIFMATALPRCASTAHQLLHLKPPGFITPSRRIDR